MIWPIAAALLLCGCANLPPEETTAQIPQTVPAVTEAAEPEGIYEPFSDLEIRTGGVVRSYQTGLADTYGLRLLNGDVLVFSGSDRTTLTRYTGENLVQSGQVILDCRLEPEDSSFQTSIHGITYYDPTANALVYLDNDLKEVSRLGMPENLMGKPVLSGDRALIYYCTADAVRVYDSGTGLDRMLKSISYPYQTAAAVLMEGRVLRCMLTDAQGLEYEIFISTETGALVSRIRQELEVVDNGQRWFAKIQDGLLSQVLFGMEGEEGQALYPADPFARSWLLPENGGAVTASLDTERTVLDYYNLDKGTRSATVELPASMEPRYVERAAGSNAVYILAYDEMGGGPVILRWDLTAVTLADDLLYSGPRYTAESPDEAALAECAARAAALGETYGLKILVGPEAASVQPKDYILEYEHQASLLHRELTALEAILEKFPRDFFRKLHGNTTVCILRSITGSAQSGSVARAGGIQFWAGETAYVALAAGEGLQQSFCHEVFHIIDGLVLSTNRVYYHWENLNPEGCTYFQDYTTYLTADVSRYLEDGNRAFIDAYSMSYPREDRARIMEYACMEGNAHYFQSEIMQNKLKTLCEGIRKAFWLEGYQEPLLWEQYLHEPLKIK
jgi:hypothetical protein